MKCTKVDHCREPDWYPVDWDSHLSLHNWVETLDLTCKNPYHVALMGSMYFAGAIASGFFVTRLGDIYGRKWPTIFSAVISIPIHLSLILSRDLNFSIVMFFLYGLTRPGKMQVSFVYVSELVPSRYRKWIGSFILLFHGSSMILAALYFLLISKSWVSFQVFALTLTVLSTATLFFVPESPKFLLEKGRLREA